MKKKLFCIVIIILFVGNLYLSVSEAETISSPDTQPASEPVEQDNDSLFMEALEIYNEGKWDEAETKFEQVIAKSPQRYDAHLFLATTYSMRKMYDDAISEYRKCLEINPNNYQAYVNLGIVYVNLNKPQKALTYLQKADNLNQYDYKTLFLIGESHYLMNDLDTALDYFLNCWQLNPDFTANTLRIADCFRHNKEFANEAAIYKKILEKNPVFSLYYRLAIALRETGDIQGEIDSYQKALALSPDHPDVMYNLGMAYYDIGDMDKSIQTLKNVADMETDFHAESLLQIAIIYYEIGKTNDAWDYYHRLKPVDAQKADQIYELLKNQ